MSWILTLQVAGLCFLVLFFATAIAVLLGAAAFFGSWVQRSIGYVIKTRAEDELLNQAADRERENLERQRSQDYVNSGPDRAAEALANLTGMPAVAPDNPLGPILPSPDQLDEAMSAGNPNDWTSELSTEQMKNGR